MRLVNLNIEMHLSTDFVEVAGFGPANTGVKVLCLRPAWRHLSKISTPGRTRTYNLRIRSALLYPVEPRVRKNVVLNHNAFIGASPEAFTFIF